MMINEKYEEFIFSIMNHLLMYFLVPILIFMCLCVACVPFYGMYYYFYVRTAEKIIELKESEWKCTDSEVRYQPPYVCGSKTRRMCGDYNYNHCKAYVEK